MAERDVTAEGDGVRELEISDARAGEIITREHRRLVEDQRTRAEGSVITDADSTTAEGDPASETAGRSERERTRAALRDAATRAGD